VEDIVYHLQLTRGHLQSASDGGRRMKKSISGAQGALLLLLGINLFNYIDRQLLAALEPDIRASFFAAGDVNAMTNTGLYLGSAFFVTYMISAPILGLLADRFSRWLIIGCAVILWSLASGASGLAATFAILVATRVCIGIGEGGYGPAAPTILSDLFPIETRGRIMAIFCAAIPVGSALGYVIGGLVGAHLGWRWAFYLVAPPGLLLGLLCFWQRDPRVAADHVVQKSRRSIRDYLNLFRTRSYLINCIAMTLMTFVTGGLGFWVPAYLRYRNQSPDIGMTIFGLITVVAGLVSTLLGGVIADKLRSRFPGSYFWVSGIGMLIACPIFVVALYVPFPAAWIAMFLAIFFLFLNTGPSNTALANVSLPAVRATAFAANIFIIHAFGDVQAFWLLGYIGGHTNMHVAFLFVSGIILLSGVAWLIGVKYLPPDTAAVENAGAS
jgi:MFS transporter, Spinster family, sphingosine-1-phosphate transporter